MNWFLFWEGAFGFGSGFSGSSLGPKETDDPITTFGQRVRRIDFTSAESAPQLFQLLIFDESHGSTGFAGCKELAYGKELVSTE